MTCTFSFSVIHVTADRLISLNSKEKHFFVFSSLFLTECLLYTIFRQQESGTQHQLIQQLQAALQQTKQTLEIKSEVSMKSRRVKGNQPKVLIAALKLAH